MSAVSQPLGLGSPPTLEATGSVCWLSLKGLWALAGSPTVS